MGPQLCSCGNRPGRPCCCPRPHSFNGAATLQLRKPCATGHDLASQVCFNGAATLQLRKQGCTGGTDEDTEGFNGAATLQLRKPSCRFHALANVVVLQWGRNFAVAETVWWMMRMNFALNASMGPQLCSCGNAPPKQAVQNMAATSFNGAATLQLRKRRCYKLTTPTPSRFNGAATLQLRKHHNGSRAGDHYGCASMGPQLCSCGN